MSVAGAEPRHVPAKASAGRKPQDNRPWQVAPAALAVLLISLFPIGLTLFLSLQAPPNGFQALAADTRFWEAGRHTLILAGIALPVELLLGLGLACLFLGRMPGKAVLVSLLAMPALVAPIIAGSTWRILFDNDYGPVNQMLGWLVGGAVVAVWTENADFVYPAILIADIWQWTPFMFVLWLAALNGVDRGQLQAAELDDAGPWRTLLRIVLPAVGPAIAVAVLIRAVDLLRLFDVVWALTRGGPDGKTETLSVLAYERLGETAQTSRLAAMALAAIVAVSLVVTLFLTLVERER